MNIYDYIILAVIAVCVVSAITFTAVQRKKGRSCCGGCDGCCAQCGKK